MTVYIVVGGFYGDEGKGKIVQYLAYTDEPEIIARGGNPNAGHVVLYKGKFFEWVDKKTGKKKRQPLWFKDARSLNKEQRSKVRSKTFPGIAKAMAEQWGKYLINEQQRPSNTTNK